ncbi:MAG: signal peptide peptidase SppA [Balneolaceae bacterium]
MKFLKTFLASILGTLTALFLLFIVLLIMVMSSSSEPEPYVRANTVLKMEITGDIPERAVRSPLDELFNPASGDPVSLRSLKRNLEKAAAHDNIEGVWVTTNFVTSSWANLETARSYFQEYKESGKFLYFSTDDMGYNSKAYFLATAADSIFSPPETSFQFEGFTAQFSFYRDMLEKIGVEPEIARVGAYKSAVEPFMNRESSPESREQTLEILNSATNLYVSAVAERLGVSSDEVNRLMNTPPIGRVEFAFEQGLLDVQAYPDEVEEHIKKRIELDEDTDLRTISFGRYSRVTGKSAGLDEASTSDKIAVIYTSGAIMPQLDDFPFGDSDGITASNVKKQLDAALDDDDVKAIVLHVNSGGGAATTSDVIWHYVRKAAESKPVVASMGNVAASGGYYIAAGADTIVANPNTITGSIGIFALLFNFQELMEENIGIRTETLKTHEFADLYDLSTRLTPQERRVFQQMMDRGYESFVSRMAESRGMSFDELQELAQGRVYTGTHAYEVGLVDVLGNLDRAIAIAAEMAGIEEYKLESFPKQRDFFQTLMSSGNAQLKAMMQSWIPSPIRHDMTTLQQIMRHPAGQQWAIMPYEIRIE